MEKGSRVLYPDSTDFCTLETQCSYLKEKNSRMLYRYISEASSEFVSAVVQRGWRRFGNYFFYPICDGCNECKSLRIDTRGFRPSRSQKRAIKKNRDTRIVHQKPTVTSHHLLLYNKYHYWKSEKDGWKHNDMSHREYYENFAEGAHSFGREVLYIRDGRLIGVDLIDMVDDGISSVYFFYDPDYAHLSLGIYSLLHQIELCQNRGLRYVYLGYWVDGCKAFAYKSSFMPLEILDGFPKIEESPQWRDFQLYRDTL